MDLGGVHDLNSPVVEAILFAFGLDDLLVADEKKFLDVGLPGEGVLRTADDDIGGIVPAHGIQRDLHGIMVATGWGNTRTAAERIHRRKLLIRKGNLDHVHIENLPLTVGATRRACDVGRDGAATLGARLELRLRPAVCTAAHALL